jgi:bifunctional non-homologous end joining protein LigD
LHEIKYDGYRIVARVDRGQIQLLTRKGEDWSGRLPWLADALRARVPLEAALIDGELVHMGADGVTRFGPLQQALSTGQHGPLVYFAFDLLHVQGIDLRRLPLEQRKQALAELLPPEPTPGRVRLSEHVLGQGEPLFTRACRLGLEGVISKRRAAPYLAGRHRDWLKVKCGRRQEVVIGGFTAARSGTRKIGALLLGVHDADGRFVYAGKVGTGLGQQEAADLRARLDELEVPRSPFSGPLPPGFSRSRFVRPEVVIEVGFTEWTSDGRMRHPVFHGVREDKRPREVRREVEVPVELAARAPARPVRHVGRARSRKPEAEVLGVRLSNPDRVLYPADGLHKLDLAEHHAALAAWMLPWVAGRPISVVRCPDGVGAPCFFQKHIHHELPPALRTADLDGGAHEPFLYLEDAAGLVALAQVGVIEIHVWGATVARPDAPDRMILDLDPDPDVPWARVKETAAAMRARLAQLGLASFLKTTGGKGLHVVAPLTPGKQDWDQVKAFTRGLALEFARAAPELFTATATKSRRKGKIYIDYLRNYRGSTSVAPYSPRARDGAPVSTPLRWDELAALDSSQKYTLANLAARLGKLREDPWAALPGTRQHLSAALLREVARG